jgi:hypothetical protein
MRRNFTRLVDPEPGQRNCGSSAVARRDQTRFDSGLLWSDLRDAHYVQVGPGTEVLLWRPDGACRISASLSQINRSSSGKFHSETRRGARRVPRRRVVEV